jgi:hypothetical protein
MKAKGIGKPVGQSAKKMRVKKHRGVIPVEAGKKKFTPKGWGR